MSKPGNISTAVRQRRTKTIKEGDTPERALYRKLEFFPTPLWATRAGAEILLDMDPDARTIWEPACGQGHMADPLKEYFPNVIASDIHDYGYGTKHDFLSPEIVLHHPEPDWIFTNPAFAHGTEFLQRGLKIAKRGVALLLRIAWLEGAERYHHLYRGTHPLTLCAPFIERVPISLGGWDADGSTATCYAFFFFDKKVRGFPRIEPIPPGTKARLHRREDVRRFGRAVAAPLFDPQVPLE